MKPPARPIPYLVVGAAIGYLIYRGVLTVDGSVAERGARNARRLMELQAALGIDVERGAQRSWLGRGPVGELLTAFYALAYWPFLLGTIGWALLRDRHGARLLRNAVAVSGVVGLVVIVTWPLAPPRLLEGFHDAVGDADLLATVAHPSGLFHPYAAMPSFHVGWMVVAALVLCRSTRRWRWWPLVPPAVMAVAVITTGNHFVLDVVAGVALALAAWWVAHPLQAAFARAAAEAAARRDAARCRPVPQVPAVSPGAAPADQSGAETGSATR